MSQTISVPFAPGVPALLRTASQDLDTVAMLVVDAFDPALFGASQWGIFDSDGNPVAIADTVVSVDFRHEFKISDYPQEQGAFVSYNKVAIPYDFRVRFAVGDDNGSGSANRQAFLIAIEAALQSLNLYTAITPDASYPNINIVHYDYRRETRAGINLLQVDVWAEEIRQTATSQFSTNATPKTAQPGGAPAVSNGPVQPAPVPPAPPDNPVPSPQPAPSISSDVSNPATYTPPALPGSGPGNPPVTLPYAPTPIPLQLAPGIATGAGFF
jgi:hypothetical protein